jgi:phosphatidylinositol alpha-mannosyltransferase
VARHFIDRYFPGDYKIIPNGVDVDRLAHAQPIARYRDGTLNIFFLGRFESRKGAMYLLKAYRQVGSAASSAAC